MPVTITRVQRDAIYELVIALKGANTRVAPIAGRVGRIGDCGLLVSLPRVQGPSGRTRSQSPWPGRQGHRAARPAPRARGPPSPSRAAEASHRGPCPARGGGVPAAALLARPASGHPAHAVAVASRARAAGTGESALGLSANQRRARQTRLPGVAIDR